MTNLVEKLKTGWMHITQNDSAILSTSKTEPPNTFEWTMSRYGLYSGNYLAWRVTSDGGVNNHYVTNTYSVRPVFYLTSNVKITGGTGTSTDPFIID